MKAAEEAVTRVKFTLADIDDLYESLPILFSLCLYYADSVFSARAGPKKRLYR